MVVTARISVVMPVRNEAATIRAAISSVQAQSIAPHEVIVADGDSDDGTRDILDELATHMPSLRIVDNPAGSIPAGLNAAIRASSGEVIARLDGHNELPPEYLERSLAMLERDGVWAAGGVFVATGTTPFGQAAAHAMHSWLGVGGGVGLLNQREAGPVDGVPLGVFRREVFDDIGLFDVDMLLSEDDELFQRLRDAGGTVWCDPALRVTYVPRSSVRALLAKYYGWGQFKVLALRKRPGMFRLRHAIPSLFVVALAGSLAVAPWSRWPLVGVIGSWSSVASLTAIRIRPRRGGWLAVVVAFAVMHIGYGAGMLAGGFLWLRGRRAPTP